MATVTSGMPASSTRLQALVLGAATARLPMHAQPWTSCILLSSEKGTISSCHLGSEEAPKFKPRPVLPSVWSQCHRRGEQNTTVTQRKEDPEQVRQLCVQGTKAQDSRAGETGMYVCRAPKR